MPGTYTGIYFFSESYAMLPLLSIKNLSIRFNNEGSQSAAVENISITLHRGKTLALVGESGSGKSVTAMAVLQLLPSNAIVEGNIAFSEDAVSQKNLAELRLKEINKIRGNKIGMIFQEPMTSLNPVLTCGQQVIESLVLHRKLSKKEATERTLSLFTQVELPDPPAMLNRYPHQLSGGQKQRVMIAIAMSCDPDLIIADEPTTALDVRVQKNILLLLKKLQEQNNIAILLITHDLGIVADVADEIAVLYKGNIVEQGNAATVLNQPEHNYTKALLACRPASNAKGKRLAVLSDFIETGNEKIKGEQVQHPVPNESNTPVATGSNHIVLSVQQLNVRYGAKKNMLGRIVKWQEAVKDVSFNVQQNEIVGLVGESGCGKTTLAKTILQLIHPTSGKILLNGKDLSELSSSQLRMERKDLQIVFQDPFGSLNPRITIGDAIMEAMQVHQLYNRQERKEKIISLLESVQLQADHYKRYPHQFSGGQRQRICLARALALHPSFILFDESVSALDVSVQAQVLNLINELKSSFHFTALFISHDLSVVHYICDRIMVMKSGKIVESGTADKIYFHPENPYTQQLIDSIPGKNLQRLRSEMLGENRRTSQ